MRLFNECMTHERTVVERRVAAPVHTVWRLLTEPESPARARGTGEGSARAVRELTPGPFGVGSRWREVRRGRGRAVVFESRVTRCAPGERYVVVVGAGAGSHTLEYTLLSYVGEGEHEGEDEAGTAGERGGERKGGPVRECEGTLVRVMIHAASPGRMGRLLAMLRAPGLAAAVRQAVSDELAAVAAACGTGRESAA